MSADLLDIYRKDIDRAIADGEGGVVPVLQLIWKLANQFRSWLELEDMIQIGNLRALKAIRKWNPKHGKLTTLIWTATRRQLINERVKEHSRIRTGPLPHEDPSYARPWTPLQMLEAADEQASIKRQVQYVFTHISEDDATLLRLRYWEGLTRPQLAERFGVAKITIDKRLQKAHARCRAILEKEQ